MVIPVSVAWLAAARESARHEYEFDSCNSFEIQLSLRAGLLNKLLPILREVPMRDTIGSMETHGNVKSFLPFPFVRFARGKVGMPEGAPVRLATFTQPLCLPGKSKSPEI
ncbi:hypothetical protein E2C01_040981 [Portunus trituberculatus]|uniref:Uncharacterized protein n=1 Tax=Portunus trituberculatus TaxID=210409 RepID=A0A5B7FHZ9_PORTR|nr:hypothetical protein [Portunus trituberculatus]